LLLLDNPPGSFCWDRLCGNEGYNEQVQDRDDLEDKNVDRRVADFIRAAYDMAATRKGNIDTMNVSTQHATTDGSRSWDSRLTRCRPLLLLLLSLSAAMEHGLGLQLQLG
jgi:hypothetical protein